MPWCTCAEGIRQLVHVCVYLRFFNKCFVHCLWCDLLASNTVMPLSRLSRRQICSEQIFSNLKLGSTEQLHIQLLTTKLCRKHAILANSQPAIIVSVHVQIVHVVNSMLQCTCTCRSSKLIINAKAATGVNLPTSTSTWCLQVLKFVAVHARSLC